MPSSTVLRSAAATALGNRSPFEHPSLGLPVTGPQRERSIEYLSEAYATGRITEYEFDQRVEIVLSATTRREMNQAFTGLAQIPVGVSRPMVLDQGSTGVTGRLLGAGAHLSGLCSWVVGPALVYGLAKDGSYAKREAAKAFNFQVVVAICFAAMVALLPGWIEGGAVAMLGVSWLVLCLAHVAHALQGENWRNPLGRVVPLRLLDEGPREPRRPKALGC